jgi:putative endonuclease
VYYEHFFEIDVAIKREKQVKGLSRLKKENLVTNFNSDWAFLNDSI